MSTIKPKPPTVADLLSAKMTIGPEIAQIAAREISESAARAKIEEAKQIMLDLNNRLNQAVQSLRMIRASEKAARARVEKIARILSDFTTTGDLEKVRDSGLV